MAKPVETLDQIFNRLSNGVLWKTEAGTAVTYSMTGIATTFPGYDNPNQSSLITVMSVAQKAYARDAFGLWDDLIAIRLEETSNSNASIAFNYTDEANEARNGLAWWWTSDTDATALAASNIWFSDNAEYGNDFNFGGFGNHAQNNYLHEIGHALGLSHPGAYDSLSGEPDYEAGAEYAQDTEQFTIMSYFRAENFRGVDHVDESGNYIYPQTPMLHDVLAMQRIYGADLTTRSGNTVYGFGAQASGTNRTYEYDFGYNSRPVLTIWDAGGTADRLDASGFNGDQIVDLRAGAYSSLSDEVQNGDLELTENVAIAYGVVIETARGGSGNDKMYGNSANNSLSGNSGNDSLFGGNGADKLNGGNGADTLRGGSGIDKLYGGVGVDKYTYVSKAEGGDSITSFSSADFFVFKGSAFGSLKSGELDASRFRSNKTGLAGDRSDRFVYKTTDDTLWYDADGIGGTKAIKMADLANNFALTADDILIA